MPFLTDLEVRFIRGKLEALLLADLIYQHPEYGPIRVPAGFNTDFASVPWFFRRIVARVGILRDAAVIHDWIYRGGERGRFTRAQGDAIFADAMAELGVAGHTRTAGWLGVRLGGWLSWRGD